MASGRGARTDPCAEVNCTFGSACVPSSDGLSAKCMCPLGCEGRPQATVCGSDGRDYRNACELHQHACKERKNVRVQRPGLCDPCKEKQNSLNLVCRVEPLTLESQTFAPPEDCPPGSPPLCASDGETYAGECVMNRTARQKDLRLAKVHPGPCTRPGSGLSRPR
ncbi:unnamed protein product [Boreogadus saida]